VSLGRPSAALGEVAALGAPTRTKVRRAHFVCVLCVINRLDLSLRSKDGSEKNEKLFNGGCAKGGLYVKGLSEEPLRN
jgi:hypothetical protein